MNNRSSYPVVVEATPDASPRRWFGDPAIDPTNVLQRRPGTVLVVQRNDRFEVLPLRATRRLPPGTSTLALVSVRPRTVVVTYWLASARPGVPFAVDAAFDCQVTDAALVLDAGCWDVQPLLRRYLAGDPAGEALAAVVDPATAGPPGVGALQTQLTARARARDRIGPPFVPGMVCRLDHLSVDLRPPAPDSFPHGPTDTPAVHLAPRPIPQDYIWEE